MDCVFCKIINREIPSRIIYEDDIVISFMNNFPDVDGHILIVPKEHYEDFTSVPADIMYHTLQVAKELAPKIIKATNQEGLSCLFNYGTSITVKHFHLHLYPGFMDKLEERLGGHEISINESIDDVFNRLKGVL